MQVYNSLTGRKEEFVSVESGVVKLYVCGITPYDYSHVGHARAVVVFDVIQKYFKYRGYKVKYVRNFTDVDDKIIRRANEEGVSWKDISEKFINEFYNDISPLKTEMPSVEPKVTEHIEDIIEFVKRLIEKGYAYQVGGDVYFEVAKFSEYGKLSKRSTDEMLAGARVEVDPRKRSPLDFALWKSSKEGEPSWDSPWGKGRPGWHIECSAMSTKYLGETFDIHGGGIDLIFPHHENEIAQSESAIGKPFARYWIHNGIITINQEKMSKSLGNFFTLRDALKKFDAEAFRLFILSSHYRSPIDFSESGLRESERALERIYTNLRILKRGGAEKHEKKERDVVLGDEIMKKFEELMDDDFNIPGVIATVFSAVRALNFYKDKIPSTLKSIEKISGVLGIFNSDPDDYLLRLRDKKTEVLNIDKKLVEEMIRKRGALRAEKNFKEADRIRETLKNMGVLLEDTPEGTIWRIE
jgi:cysteinyl-tRNA synthetase